MTLDARFRSLARKMTGKYGKAITLRKTESTYDPATGQTTETTTDYAVKTEPPQPYEQRYIDGQLIQTGDMRLLVAATDPGLTDTPDLEWKALMDGDTWQIVTIRPIWSGEQVAAYELQTRR